MLLLLYVLPWQQEKKKLIINLGRCLQFLFWLKSREGLSIYYNNPEQNFDDGSGLFYAIVSCDWYHKVLRMSQFSLFKGAVS